MPNKLSGCRDSQFLQAAVDAAAQPCSAAESCGYPTRLASFDKEKKVQVIIETPKGSRNKYAWDQDQQIFELKKVLPEGMAFPHDFGFIPSTEADDGDPIDVLVLMDQPVFTGCLVKARLVR